MSASVGLAEDRELEPDQAIDALTGLVADGEVVVLSGAGLSTESGIPDYRGDGSAARRSPMTYQAFAGDPLARRRYWARAHLGWHRLGTAVPNAGHRAVAELERHGQIIGTITQNVDGLHQAAGARTVIDLHGRLDQVRCLRCDEITARETVWSWFDEANPGWSADIQSVNPDGDVDLPERSLEGFTVVDCTLCGGLLKPDVVYVGESVPAQRVQAAHELVDRARALLVLGSSLTVWSGRRFVVRAARAGTAVAIVNDGPTRSDDLAGVKVQARLGLFLTELVRRLGP